MSSINPKISSTKEEHIGENTLNWTIRENPERSALKSAFTPVLDSLGTFRYSKIYHNSLFSPFMPHFSEGKNVGSTLSTQRLTNDLNTPSPKLWHIIESKESSIQGIHMLNPQSSISELIKKQEMNINNQVDTTRQIKEEDHDFLENNECSSIKSTSNKKTRKRKVKQKNDPQQIKRKPFMCKYCTMSFNKAQALGGHMSRTHPGESREYKQKKIIRKNRELERAKLFLAKRKFFQSIDCDYDDLLRTPEGKMRARMLLNRARIKKLKKTLTREELNEFLEEKLIDDISN